MINNISDKFFLIKDESQLESKAQQYPWCSILQLSLLHHYKKNNAALLQQQSDKTVLFFNNINWLNWQLQFLSKETEGEQNLQFPTVALQEDKNPEQIQQSLSAITAQADTKEDVIAFEPLHAVDYFASQGIKITEEPVTGDKLGNQMKSFTEWLKSMKKIHKENLPAGDEQTDKQIQQIAEHSNADAAVITEAMADILVRQNKIEKAIEVYDKLSLLNPSKSAYFAAKIESLSTDR